MLNDHKSTHTDMAGAAVIVESEVVSPRLKRDDNVRIARKNSIAHVYTSTNGGIV